MLSMKNSFSIRSLRSDSLRATPALVLVSLGLFTLSLSACQSGAGTQGGGGSLTISDFNGADPLQPSSPKDQAPPENPSGTPIAPSRSWSVDAMIFAGTGTWGTEVSSLKSILSAQGASYLEVSSADLNSMSLDELADFGVLVFPGGYGGQQSSSLTSATRERIRQAVQQRGVGYTGFCAGSFIAVAPAPSPGGDVSYGIGVVDGPVLDYYYLENQGVTADMTLLTFADGTTRDVLWYGGPITPAGDGDVVARYPNGDPAISEIDSGQGLVVLSGGHPGAPASVKSSFGLSDSDGTDFALTWSLIRAAMNHERLPAE